MQHFSVLSNLCCLNIYVWKIPLEIQLYFRKPVYVFRSLTTYVYKIREHFMSVLLTPVRLLLL